MGGKVHALFLPKTYIPQSRTNLYARTEVTPSCKGNGVIGHCFRQPECPAKNCITVVEAQALPQQSSGKGPQQLDSLWMMELKENRASAKREILCPFCYLRNARLTPEFLRKLEVKAQVWCSLP